MSLPPGVTQTSHNRFEFAHRASQVYFGMIFGIVGIIVPIAVITSVAQKGQANASLALAAIFPIIFCGVFVFFCYRFKWTKMIMDFNSRQVTYIVGSFPFILCQAPNQTTTIDSLANLHVHDTGVRSGGRRSGGGVPILEIQILINGATQNAIPIASVNGHFNASPIMNQWTAFLQSQGVNVAQNNSAMQQLQAIMPMLAAPTMVMAGQPMLMYHPGTPPPPHHFQQQAQPGRTMMMPPPGSPMNVYPGTNMSPTNGYGAPPPPPPPGGSPMPGFATYENTAVPGQNYNYAPAPIQHY